MNAKVTEQLVRIPASEVGSRPDAAVRKGRRTPLAAKDSVQIRSVKEQLEVGQAVVSGPEGIHHPVRNMDRPHQELGEPSPLEPVERTVKGVMPNFASIPLQDGIKLMSLRSVEPRPCDLAGKIVESR